MASVRMTPYRISYEMEGDKYLEYFDTQDEMMYAACQLLAFNDCCPVHNLNVYESRHEWKYMGWQPGMIYEWVRDDNEIWVDAFPQWDH